MRLEIVSRRPAGHAHPVPLLFIHGALHGAWCWEAHFLDYFARRGYAAHAVNLRGHGGSNGREGLRWTRIADYVDDVASAVRQLPGDPVLVGHSMGAFIVQKYLERHHAPGAVLLSSPPPSGFLRTNVRFAARRPLVFARMVATFSLAPLVATPALAREAFFSHDFPEDPLREYWRLMQEESFRALLDMVALDLPRPAKVRTPLLVLGAERDHMLTRADVEATARAYRTRAQFIPGVAHDSMLEARWEDGAARILAWLERLPEYGPPSIQPLASFPVRSAPSVSTALSGSRPDG